MSQSDLTMLRHMDKVLFEDSGETPAQVRRRLEEKGVNVQALIARVKSAAGAAYRETLTQQAKQKQSETAGSRGRVFGDLIGMGRDRLLRLIRAAAGGEY